MTRERIGWLVVLAGVACSPGLPEHVLDHIQVPMPLRGGSDQSVLHTGAILQALGAPHALEPWDQPASQQRRGVHFQLGLGSQRRPGAAD